MKQSFFKDFEICEFMKYMHFFCYKAMEHLQSFIQDCDRKTELAKRRLKETQEELSEEANTKVNVINIVKQTKQS